MSEREEAAAAAEAMDETAERCVVCSCTEDRACRGGCSWVAPGLCSSCIPTPASLMRAGQEALDRGDLTTHAVYEVGTLLALTLGPLVAMLSMTTVRVDPEGLIVPPQAGDPVDRLGRRR